MTDDELAEIRQGVEHCEQTHAGQQYPFCENYGCMLMRPLLDEIERLRFELAQQYAIRNIMNAPRANVVWPKSDT